jgi:hypothetical protein
MRSAAALAPIGPALAADLVAQWHGRRAGGRGRGKIFVAAGMQDDSRRTDAVIPTRPRLLITMTGLWLHFAAQAPFLAWRQWLVSRQR